MNASSNPVQIGQLLLLVFVGALVCFGWFAFNKPQETNIGYVSADVEVIPVWPKSAKGKRLAVGSEYDTTTITSELIADKRVQRITNVAEAELHFWPADAEKNTGTSVIICPGGGFHILAWDLEGTEIAQWLNSIGVNAFILKYRVPTAKDSEPSAAPTEDLQRSIALVRHHADKWNLDPQRIGTLGFSAGGNVVANAAFTNERYEAIDEVDERSARANFIIPVYGARMAKQDGGLRNGMKLTQNSPPAFIVHTYDDFCPVHNALELARLYREADVPVECHIFDAGGHGYGARHIDGLPVTDWPNLCEKWLAKNGWLD